jgi:hypothetical protein
MNEEARPAELQGGPSSLGVGAKAVPADARAFSRYGYELPLLGALGAVATIELVVVHLLLSQWSHVAALVLSLATLVTIIRVGLTVRDMARWPTLVDDQAVVVRHGGRGEIHVLLATIESVENVAFAPEERGRTIFRATLLAQPNVALRLGVPVQVGKKEVTTITMRLDDPAAFIAEVEQRRRAFVQELGRRL